MEGMKRSHDPLFSIEYARTAVAILLLNLSTNPFDLGLYGELLTSLVPYFLQVSSKIFPV